MQLRSGVSPLLQLVPSSSQNMAQVLFSSKYGTSFRKFSSYINAFLSCTIFYHQVIIIIVKYQCNLSWCRFVVNITDRWREGDLYFESLSVQCVCVFWKSQKGPLFMGIAQISLDTHLSAALSCMSLNLLRILLQCSFLHWGDWIRCLEYWKYLQHWHQISNF